MKLKRFGSINEARKTELSVHEIGELKKLTALNDHTEARILAAKYSGNLKLVKAYEAVKELASYLGGVPRELNSIRYDVLDKHLKASLGEKFENINEIWSSL